MAIRWIKVIIIALSWLIVTVEWVPPAKRDRLIQLYFRRGYSYGVILCFLLVMHGVSMSLRTLKRHLRRLNLRRRGRHTPLSRVCRCLLIELQGSGSLLGYRSMHQRLRQCYNIVIPREIVRALLLAADPTSVQLRAQRRLQRRRYSVKGSNYCWHIDGMDKLKTYGFAIHGCIDGFSRRVLWLEVASTNNNSAVIAGYYLSIVEQYGCPKIIRGDRGTENSRIAYLQPFLQRNGVGADNSFQYGRSASNQRIEAWWSQLRRYFTDWWLDFFQTLKDNGILDKTNPIHLDCVRFAFMGVLQNELNDIQEMWNTHYIRPDRARRNIGGVPDELYFFPEVKGYTNHIFNVDPLDIAFCKPYTKEKPLPVPPEFLDLAEILMHENGWFLPDNCEDALKFYVDFLNNII